MDDRTGELTRAGIAYIHTDFVALIKADPKEAMRRYYNMEPIAQAYIRKHLGEFDSLAYL